MGGWATPKFVIDRHHDAARGIISHRIIWRRRKLKRANEKQRESQRRETESSKRAMVQDGRGRKDVCCSERGVSLQVGVGREHLI